VRVTGFQARWRLNIAFAFEEPRYVFVQSSHAPPIGKCYVTGED
jgi:hypothetical protein